MSEKLHGEGDNLFGGLNDKAEVSVRSIGGLRSQICLRFQNSKKGISDFRGAGTQRQDGLFQLRKPIVVHVDPGMCGLGIYAVRVLVTLSTVLPRTCSSWPQPLIVSYLCMPIVPLRSAYIGHAW